MLRIFTSMILILLLSGCGKQPVEKYAQISGRVWTVNDSQKFTVNIKEPGEYRLYIQIRYSQDYNFSNLWIGLTKKDLAGKVEKARFNIPLFDVHGRPYGSFAGKFFDRSYPDAEVDGQKLTLKFDAAGNYDLSIRQLMRVDALYGLDEVGIRLVRQ
jgi:gliding motility-associated lipoprotein GldH